ncbi:MAG: hypothetical protein GZ086_06315 [Gelidibacter sp.]|nr:hypothetical protein [Gelidibacter sp.]
MEKYRNSGGDSGASAFEIGSDFIIEIFKGNPKPYRYSYGGRAGQNHVENMKRLARSESGLNGYINQFVKFKYD